MDDYRYAWELRCEALTSLLGPPDLTSAFPIYLGGLADVMTFRQFVPGLTYVTSGLTGMSMVEQKPNATGRRYELMICTPREEGWAAHLLSTLARYTLDSVLNSGDTMDCPILPGSSLKALLFTGAELKGPLAFDEAEYDVLLCIGITPAELKVCQTTGSAGVLEDLKARNIFPMTDIERR